MAGQYALVYGLSTAFFGWVDKSILNIGGFFSGSSASFQVLFSTAFHAALATWAMDNFGMPLGVGSGTTRYIVLPLAAGATNAVIGGVISGWVNQHDSGNADMTAFLTEALSAAIGVYIVANAI